MKKQASHNQALESVGVNILTGEADRFSMRLLCDLNADGADLIREFFGLPPSAELNPNWNSQVNSKEAVASVMLTRSVFPELIRFALYLQGFQYVLMGTDGLGYVAFNKDDIESDYYLKRYMEAQASGELEKFSAYRMYRNPAGDAPHIGSRNIHAFTGRAE